MKKVFAVFSAIAIMVTLTACGAKNNHGTGSGNSSGPSSGNSSRSSSNESKDGSLFGSSDHSSYIESMR